MKRKAFTTIARRSKRAKYSNAIAAFPRPSRYTMRGPEVKYLDFSIVVGGTPSTYYPTALNYIGQGTARDERIGNRVSIIGMDVFGMVGTNEYERANYFLQGWDSGSPTAASFSTLGGFPYPEKFKTLYLCSPGEIHKHPLYINKKFRFYKPIVSKYTGTLGNSITNNVLWHVHWSGASTTNTNLRIRVYFLDD